MECELNTFSQGEASADEFLQGTLVADERLRWRG
jgi:hypothetical protein